MMYDGDGNPNRDPLKKGERKKIGEHLLTNEVEISPETEKLLEEQAIPRGRYPYTIACDFIRRYTWKWHSIEGDELSGDRSPVIRECTLSRADASATMRAFEAVFGLTHEEMVIKLADYALTHPNRHS